MDVWKRITGKDPLDYTDGDDDDQTEEDEAADNVGEGIREEEVEDDDLTLSETTEQSSNQQSSNQQLSSQQPSCQQSSNQQLSSQQPSCQQSSDQNASKPRFQSMGSFPDSEIHESSESDTDDDMGGSSTDKRSEGNTMGPGDKKRKVETGDAPGGGSRRPKRLAAPKFSLSE